MPRLLTLEKSHWLPSSHVQNVTAPHPWSPPGLALPRVGGILPPSGLGTLRGLSPALRLPVWGGSSCPRAPAHRSLSLLLPRPPRLPAGPKGSSMFAAVTAASAHFSQGLPFPNSAHCRLLREACPDHLFFFFKIPAFLVFMRHSFKLELHYFYASKVCFSAPESKVHEAGMVLVLFSLLLFHLSIPSIRNSVLDWTVSRSVVCDSFQPHGLYSPPGSSDHGILQARILEWVAILFSRGSS